MPPKAKTDDEIGLNPKYRERAEWLQRVLGIAAPVQERLDLADTTSEASAQNAVPLILNQIREALAPLAGLPKADIAELRLALSKAGALRSALNGETPSPKEIVAIRRRLGELPSLVVAAVDAVTRLDERRTQQVQQASLLNLSDEADPSEDSALIGTFNDQKAAVGDVFADGILTGQQVSQAETALQAARQALQDIAAAVQERYAGWARRIEERADELVQRYKAQKLDPALWQTPRETREAIARVLVPS